MSIGNSISPKSHMKKQVEEYVQSLHDLSEGSKGQYSWSLNAFADYLEKKGVVKFEDVTKTDIGQFLSTKKKQNTRNLYIAIIKSFYKNYLGSEKPVEHLHQRMNQETITPSELLTPSEVLAIADEAGKRRDLYKVIILTLFESCARISELLQLRIGDVIFSGALDNEKNTKLIATLHFKRAKGAVRKQPVVLTMFASELKRWVENHPFKGDRQAFLFPSPKLKTEAIEYSTVVTVLENAGERIGIDKRVNPHWFRHSGLSYFVNDLGYNEQLLMWRAGWRNTQMAQRYVHSGAELERKAYLERVGYLSEEKPEPRILPKTCPHCQAANPFSNVNCDFCGMPLKLDDYKREIEKKRNVESLYLNLKKISAGELSEGQKERLEQCGKTVEQLMNAGEKDLVMQYLHLLLETWVKMFLAA